MMTHRWILVFDGSSTNYHALVMDVDEEAAREFALMVSTTQNVPVYVYKTNGDAPIVVRNLHSQAEIKRIA